MSFDYDKIKEKREDQSFWASYSDLFMVMSLVFLLLYVVSSLRNGTYSLQKNLEYERVSELNEDLKQQLKVYNTLKDDYLQTQASPKQMESYQLLMDQLDLLEDKAKEEKKELRKRALENEKKERALNKYQQLVRNIINSNVMAQATIKHRGKLIDKVKEESKQQISQLSSKYTDVSKSLQKTKSELSQTQQELLQEGRQKAELVGQLETLRKQKQEQMQKLERRYNQEITKKQQQFEQRLSQQKMSAQAKEKALREYRSKVAQEKQQLKKQMASLSQEMKANEKEHKKAKEVLNARKEIAEKIKTNFSKAGVKAQVDEKTGDVILNFGDEYFDTGKYNLKPGMKDLLDESIPIYAKSLFEDQKIAEKLSFVEIVGFASPTYRGKFIDPQSMKEEDRQAINYNLDLSYYRARSIFNYIFDQKKMNYQHQKNLRSLVKVTGRSFLAERVGDTRGIASGMSKEEFCETYDCLGAQKVIIKFDLEE